MPKRGSRNADVSPDGKPTADGRAGGPRFRQLKPRPGQSGEEVAAHQRGRIHAATIELVDEGGYGTLTATGIARAAGVSNRTFYENFGDKDECFLATYDLIVRHTAREVMAAMGRECEWRAKMRAGFLAFAREVAEKPKAARLALLEAFAAGAAARDRMRHTSGLFEALVDDSFSGAGDGVVLPPLIVRGVVAGGTRVARARLLDGEETRLTSEAGPLLRWALSLRDPAVAGLRPEPDRAAARLAAADPPSEPVAGRRLLGDEREMILAAAARLTAEEGYEALTIPRIRRAAGISRRRFDAHFEDVPSCFLAAAEMLMGEIMAQARSAYLAADDWPTGIHRAFTAACQGIAADPVLVRLAFQELLGAQVEGSRWRIRLIANLSSFVRGSAPPEQRPSELEAEASIGAAWALVNHFAARGRARQLPQLAGTLSYLVLAPAIGAREAVEVAARVPADLAACG